MRITKSKLKQIIKEELNEALPPHLQSKVDAYEKKKQKYSITDVTPPGYGPDEEHYAGEESDDDLDYEAGLNEPHEYDQVAALNLGTPEEDPMKRTRQGRGQPSRLRKKVMKKEDRDIESQADYLARIKKKDEEEKEWFMKQSAYWQKRNKKNQATGASKPPPQLDEDHLEE